MKALITQNQENTEIEVYKDGQLSPEFVKAVENYSNSVVTSMSISAQQIIDFPKGEQIIEKMEEGDDCDSKQDIYFYPNCYFELQYTDGRVVGMLMGFGEYGDEQGWVDVTDYTKLLQVLRYEYTKAWAEKYQELFPKRDDIEPQDCFRLGD